MILSLFPSNLKTTQKKPRKQQSKGNFKWFKFNQSRRRIWKERWGERLEKIEKNSSTSSSSAEFINSDDFPFVFSMSSRSQHSLMRFVSHRWVEKNKAEGRVRFGRALTVASSCPGWMPSLWWRRACGVAASRLPSYRPVDGEKQRVENYGCCTKPINWVFLEFSPSPIFLFDSIYLSIVFVRMGFVPSKLDSINLVAVDAIKQWSVLPTTWMVSVSACLRRPSNLTVHDLARKKVTKYVELGLKGVVAPAATKISQQCAIVHRIWPTAPSPRSLPAQLHLTFCISCRNRFVVHFASPLARLPLRQSSPRAVISST